MFTRRRESHLLQTVGATVIGMSAGVILGMLIAPKQGKEIRACIPCSVRVPISRCRQL